MFAIRPRARGLGASGAPYPYRRQVSWLVDRRLLPSSQLMPVTALCVATSFPPTVTRSHRLLHLFPYCPPPQRGRCRGHRLRYSVFRYYSRCAPWVPCPTPRACGRAPARCVPCTDSCRTPRESGRMAARACWRVHDGTIVATDAIDLRRPHGHYSSHIRVGT